MRILISAALTVSLVALLWAGTQTINGINISDPNSPTPGPWPLALATQDTNTQFGDMPTDPAGNELDRVFVDADQDNLFIGLTGNFGDNNALQVYLDVAPTPSPAQTLMTVADPNNPACTQTKIPIVLGMMSQTVFDPNFTPDYYLGVSVGKFPGQDDNLLVFAADLTDLSLVLVDPNNANTALGIGAVGTGDGTLTGDTGTEIAIDNSNALGVTEWTALDPTPDPNQPATATTGMEIKLPRSLVNLSGPSTLKLFAFITNNVQGGGQGPLCDGGDPNDPNDDVFQTPGPCGRFGFASNQALPGLGGNGSLGTFSPGGCFLIDFTTAQGPGTQHTARVVIP